MGLCQQLMIIYRYILKEYGVCLFTISAAVLMIFMINSLSVYMKFATSGSMTFELVLKIILLRIPIFLGYTLPLSSFLTVLFINGKFYATRQFDVLFASGVSRLRLMAISMFFLFIVSLLVGFLIMWMSPRVNAFIKTEEARVAENYSIAHIIPKQFHDFSNKTATLYADKVDRYNSILKNIFMASQPNGFGSKDWTVVIAKRASVSSNKQLGQHVILEEGYRYQNSAQNDGGVKATYFDQYMHSEVQQKAKVIKYRPYQILFTKLWALSKHNKEDMGWLQWYISMPISVLILGLVVFPLSKVDARSGKYAKFIPAIALYAVYVNCLYMGRGWISKGIMLGNYGILSVHVLMLIVAMVICGIHFGWFKRCAN